MQQELAEAAMVPSVSIGNQVRRWGEGIAFVGIWIASGWMLKLDTNSYLLLGVPLTLVFQVLVRRQPVRALWVRDAPTFGWRWVGPAAVLTILPVYSLVEALQQRAWIISAWMAAACAGAIAAGYALVHFRRSTVRPFVMCQVVAGTIGIGIMVGARVASAMDRAPLPLMGLRDFLLFFPVCFIIEEVAFRGALDSHLHRRHERSGFMTALLGSVLWGLWHLPTVPADDRSVFTAAALSVVHALIGVPLAIYWRQSGNLAVTSFAHALIDGVRDGLRLNG